MKNLNLLFKDKLTIIIAALLILTLLACIPFVPSSAKYTTTGESEFDFRVSSGVAVLRTGPNEYKEYSRLCFRQALGELMMQEVDGNSYEDWSAALDDVYYIDIIQADTPPESAGEVLSKGSHTVAESGTVAVQWDSTNHKITISSPGVIYASRDCQDLFRGKDVQDSKTKIWDYGLTNLVSVNLPNLDTSRVTTIDNLFNGTKIKKFSFSSFDTSLVENMSGVFGNCSEITSVGGSDCDIDISTLKTSKALNMVGFFTGCANLERVDFSVLPEATVNLNRINNLFYDCKKLNSVKVGGNFVTSGVQQFLKVFENCSSLVELDLSGMSTASVASNSGFELMFAGCTNLKTLNISGFSTSNANTFKQMFQNCSNLETINFGSGFTTSGAKIVTNMFDGCSKLTSLGSLQLDLTKVNSSAEAMFRNCASLTTIEFAKGATGITSTKEMFKGCSSLTKLDLSKFDFSKNSKSFNYYKDMFSDHTAESPLTVIYPTADGAWPMTNGKYHLQYKDSDLTTQYLNVTFTPAS